MTISLKEQLQNEIKTAMKAKQAERLGTLRLLSAAIKQLEVDSRDTVIDDATIIALVEKEIKQRKDAIQTYEKSGHPDRAAAEQQEITILQEFLPEQASDEEVQTCIQQAITQLQAQGISGNALMGKVMGLVKPQLAGRADMAVVSQHIKAQLPQ